MLEREPRSELRPVRMAVLSTFTGEFLRPYLVVEAAKRGLALQTYFGGYGQLEASLVGASSDLLSFGPEIIVLALRLEDLLPALLARYVSRTARDLDTELAAVDERIAGLLRLIRERSDAHVLLCNFAPPLRLEAGIADRSLPLPQGEFIDRANARIDSQSREHIGVYTFDLHRLVEEVGVSCWFDERLSTVARNPLGVDAQIAMASALARYAKALTRPPVKCLVVDLDGVLWGGVLGEDGVGGIELGEDYPGSAYKAFQRRLLSLRDQGVLLAIASKNNEDEVRAVFASHPDMVLRLEQFSAIRIDWQDKATNLLAIASELNIGIDAVAYFDDSPIERAWVHEQVPEVRVIDVPTSSVEYVSALDRSELFDRLAVSEDDRKRPDMFRRSLAPPSSDAAAFEGFLRDLDMAVAIGDIDDRALPRVEQLLAKTNQFNLTTRRHPAAWIKRMIAEGAIGIWARVSDRFGESGLTGVAIVLPEADGTRWTIDTLLLSCRVIGRHIERILVTELAQRVRKRQGLYLVGEYVPTAKNGQVAQLYDRLGFVSKSDDPARRLWELDLLRIDLTYPDFIRVSHGQ